MRSGPVITLGSRVAVTDADGERLVVRIVDPVEAYLDEERISSTSPLASALLGHVVGDECVVVAPASTWTATVAGCRGADLSTAVHRSLRTPSRGSAAGSTVGP